MDVHYASACLFPGKNKNYYPNNLLFCLDTLSIILLITNQKEPRLVGFLFHDISKIKLQTRNLEWFRMLIFKQTLPKVRVVEVTLTQLS